MYKEFYDQVKEMRRLQQNCTVKVDHQDVSRTLQYEKRVDIMINQIEVAKARLNGYILKANE